MHSYLINIVIVREDGEGESLEVEHIQRYPAHALQKCPDCGWLNFTVEAWDDTPPVCDNPDCGRVRHPEEERQKQGSGDYLYCAACERWYSESAFPGHLMYLHLRLPGEEPYDNIPGKEGM